MEKEVMTTEKKKNEEKYSERKFVRRVVPIANVHPLEKGFEIEIELPGVSINEVEISLNGENLTVSAMRPAVEHVGYSGPSLPPTKYARSFRLRATELDRDGITAKASDGLLKLFVPKAPGAQPRKISISQN